MLPPIDRRGLLPSGVHTATLAEIERVFATNVTRQHLLEEFRRFTREKLAGTAAGLELYMAGSYLSDKVVPGDIDCAVQLPMPEVAGRLPLLGLMNDGRHPPKKGALWDTYRVDFYVSFTGIPGQGDFVDFFQYVGSKTASLRHLNEKDRRGIVRVE
jgi:hypothetical protein